MNVLVNPRDFSVVDDVKNIKQMSLLNPIMNKGQKTQMSHTRMNAQ